MTKKSDCIYAKECDCNCGICTIYKSTKPKNRDRLIMDWVKFYRWGTFDNERRMVLKKVQAILTEAEYRIFEFEISNNGL